MSLPTWERGLKFYCFNVCNFKSFVAPDMGAWIEICIIVSIAGVTEVAPDMGAWIEIMISLQS